MDSVNKLSPLDKERILEWLAAIGETDPDMVSDVLLQCHLDPAARRYFLKRWAELSVQG